MIPGQVLRTSTRPPGRAGPPFRPPRASRPGAGLVDPRPQGLDRDAVSLRLQVRLAELLVGRDLIVGMVGDQAAEPLRPSSTSPSREALDRQPVTEERVGRILGEALLEHHASSRLLRHSATSSDPEVRPPGALRGRARGFIRTQVVRHRHNLACTRSRLGDRFLVITKNRKDGLKWSTPTQAGSWGNRSRAGRKHAVIVWIGSMTVPAVGGRGTGGAGGAGCAGPGPLREEPAGRRSRPDLP